METIGQSGRQQLQFKTDEFIIESFQQADPLEYW